MLNNMALAAGSCTTVTLKWRLEQRGTDFYERQRQRQTGEVRHTAYYLTCYITGYIFYISCHMKCYITGHKIVTYSLFYNMLYDILITYILSVGYWH